MMVGLFVLILLKFLGSGSLVHANDENHASGPPYCEDGYPVVIIGSGLAGHAAAAELSSILSMDSISKSFGEHPIIVLDKESKFGGNSMKATSGINGALSEYQISQSIEDNINDFRQDTIYSATKSYDKPSGERFELISQLTEESGEAVNWLHNKFELDLSKISQCGGHSHPRTHRPPAGPAGNIIVKTVHKSLENNPKFSVINIKY